MIIVQTSLCNTTSTSFIANIYQPTFFVYHYPLFVDKSDWYNCYFTNLTATNIFHTKQ